MNFYSVKPSVKGIYVEHGKYKLVAKMRRAVLFMLPFPTKWELLIYATKKLRCN